MDFANHRDIVLDMGDRELVEVPVKEWSVVVIVHQGDGDDSLKFPGPVVGANPQRILVSNFSIETLSDRDLSRDRMNRESAICEKENIYFRGFGDVR